MLANVIGWALIVAAIWAVTWAGWVQLRRWRHSARRRRQWTDWLDEYGDHDPERWRH